MRKGEAITEAKLERIQLAVQLQAHRAMVADPISGPDKVADDVDALLPNAEADAARIIQEAGLDPSERNLNAVMRALYLGTVGARLLYEKGIEPPAVPGDPISGPTILEAAEAYQDAADVATSAKTRKQLLSSARLFTDHVGKAKPVAAVTGKDAVAFLDRLAKINPDYRRDPKSGELTLARLEESYPATGGKGLSAATINRHAMHMRVLISWLVRRHELPENHQNPFAGKSRKVKNQTADNGEGGSYLPMSDGEIADLLKGAPLAREFGQNFNACIGWLIALGAYTGARAGELCELTKDDVQEKDGIPFIAIRSGKTDSAARTIPLHRQLIKAGFLDYVATCQGPLFGITGKTLSKRFPAYRRSRSVDRPGVVFHSLRKSFVARLEEAEVSADTAALLAGHRSRRSFTFTVYSPHGPTLRKLSEAVSKVSYDGLNLPMDGQ
jgi:integrase